MCPEYISHPPIFLALGLLHFHLFLVSSTIWSCSISLVPTLAASVKRQRQVVLPEARCRGFDQSDYMHSCSDENRNCSIPAFVIFCRVPIPHFPMGKNFPIFLEIFSHSLLMGHIRQFCGRIFPGNLL